MRRRTVCWILIGVGGTLVAALGLVSLAGPRIARLWVERAFRESSGLEVRIGRVSAGIRPWGLSMHDVRLLNPADFGPGEALMIRELRVEVPWRAVWRREPTLDLVRLDVPKLVVERHPGGTSNWQRIQEIASSPSRRPVADPDHRPSEGPPPPADQPPGVPDGPRVPPTETRAEGTPPLRIARLNLKVGAVEIREVRPDRPEPKVQRLELNLDQTWTNVTDLTLVGAELAGMVMIRAAPLLLSEAMGETVAGGAARAVDKLERKAARLLEKLGVDAGAVTNVMDQGLEELRRALPTTF